MTINFSNHIYEFLRYFLHPIIFVITKIVKFQADFLNYSAAKFISKMDSFNYASHLNSFHKTLIKRLLLTNQYRSQVKIPNTSPTVYKILFATTHSRESSTYIHNLFARTNKTPITHTPDGARNSTSHSARARGKNLNGK